MSSIAAVFLEPPRVASATLENAELQRGVHAEERRGVGCVLFGGVTGVRIFLASACIPGVFRVSWRRGGWGQDRVAAFWYPVFRGFSNAQTNFQFYNYGKDLIFN